ncbi:MAG: DMT family transporter [Elusimicrobiota bacterium]|nr:MAG: DMT family transporter [Elusimicrobiota bacterium]
MRHLLLAAAVLCLSLPALFIRFAAAPIEAIGFWRLALACAALAPFAWRRRAAWTPAKARATALAAACFFLHLWTFTWAVRHTTVANLMLAFSTHPLWTGVGAWLLFGERLGRRELGGLALAGAGMLVLFGGSARLGGSGLAGDLSALVSAITFSGWVLAGRGVRRGLDNVSFLLGAYGATAAFFLLLGAARGSPMTGYPPATWAALAGLAFAVSLGGHGLFSYLLNEYGVLTLSCAKLVEPVLAALGAFWLFGEPLSPASARPSRSSPRASSSSSSAEKPTSKRDGAVMGRRRLRR